MASPPLNPDTRPLPPGWVQQYNWEFYVNTREQPPRSSWEHPLGPPGPPGGYSQPPYQYGPPSGNYGQGGPGYPQGSYQPQGGRGTELASFVYSLYPDIILSLLGFFGGSGGQQQPLPPKKSTPGMGTALLAGGAGLAGGALLMEAFDHHEDRVEEQAYDAGLNQGYDRGYDLGYDQGIYYVTLPYGLG
ncbi:hypothetical protein V8B97DRAFT_173453 [Scleroderma yunnanense]